MTTNLTAKMNTKLTSKVTLAALLALLTTISIRAGTITLVSLPATGTDAASGINSANIYVCCVDFGSGTAVGSINSVPFVHFGPTSGTSVNVTDTPHGGKCTLTTTDASGFRSVGSGGATVAADGSTKVMLTDQTYVATAGSPVGTTITLDFNGLVATAQYSLRFYYRQWSATGTFPRRSMNVAFNGEGSSQAYSGNPLDEDASGANAFYLEYDFTAAGSDVTMTLTCETASTPPQLFGATLQQTAGPPPPLAAAAIATQPVGFTNWVGLTNSLSVTASGNPMPTYQWYQNSSLLSGATSPTLTFSPLDPTNAGSYYVIVQNTTNSVVNSVQSSTVSVGVLADNPITNVISPTLSQVALPPIGTDAATGIDPSGTYLCVLDFGTTAFAGQVNGITFTPVSLQTTQSGTDPNYLGTWTTSTTDVNGFKSVAGGGLGGQADGNMASVLTGASYLGVAPTNTTATFSFGGLTFGAKYALRYYYKQWVVDSPFRMVQFTFNGDGTNAVFQTDEDIGGGGSYYIEYDFTAAGGAVSLLLTDESSQANYGPMIYAITLQQTAAAPALVAPVINTQPVGFTNWIGLSGSLSVTASGNPSPTYQWYQDGSQLSGQTTAILSLSPLATANAGSYYVIVQNTTNSVVNSVQSSTVSVGVIGTNVFSPTLSQVQLPASGTDVATGIGNGTNYLCVLDFGLSAYAATINGIIFTPVNLGSVTNLSGVDPNYGGTWTASTTDTAGFRNVAGGGASIPADGQMLLVLAGASYVSVAPEATTITFDFGGLTPGAQYSLCYYFRQYVTGDSPTRPVQFTFNGDTTTNGTCTVDEDIGGAYCIAYAFTAANSTASLLLTDESAVANEGPMIYAITLQQTAPVVLNYSLSGTSLTLSWDPTVTSLVLESATQLPTTPSSWTPVSGVVNNSVTVDASTGKQFYRLLKQ
jgi:hypothetical protein